jgi:voltage-gated sodium channel
MHDTSIFQSFFGGVILLSFFISLVQTEMVPAEGSLAQVVLEQIDLSFTALFTLELTITWIAHWFWRFFEDPWHIFDAGIVSVSLASLVNPAMPAVNSIRAIRVLRAVRLLKKSKYLAPIVHALLASIVPVLNTFVLMGLVTCIYASMAVGLFGEKEPVLFGKLSASLFTMFQVCTGDSWASGIVRQMFDDDGNVEPLPVIFFVSYMLVVGVVLINIVVAVLLDEFLSTMAKSRAEFERMEVLENPVFDKGCLDPLMEVLVNYRSLDDLFESVNTIFYRIDIDSSGSVSYDEFHEGLPKVVKNIGNISLEDWYELTDEFTQAGMDAADMELDLPSFQRLIFGQLKNFLLRSSNKALAGGEAPYDAIILILKWLMITFEESAGGVDIVSQFVNAARYPAPPERCVSAETPLSMTNGKNPPIAPDSVGWKSAKKSPLSSSMFMMKLLKSVSITGEGGANELGANWEQTNDDTSGNFVTSQRFTHQAVASSDTEVGVLSKRMLHLEHLMVTHMVKIQRQMDWLIERQRSNSPAPRMYNDRMHAPHEASNSQPSPQSFATPLQFSGAFADYSRRIEKNQAMAGAHGDLKPREPQPSVHMSMSQITTELETSVHAGGVRADACGTAGGFKVWSGREEGNVFLNPDPESPLRDIDARSHGLI